jgi:hypothetical protein
MLSMAATATKPTQLATEPATPLERLHHERAGLTDEATRLAGVLTRLKREAAAGSALSDELAKLSAVETDEMKVWAAGGCVGAAPKGKQTERQAIAVKMAGTNAAAAAAMAAMHDVDDQIKRVNTELANISAKIEGAALDAMQAELADIRIDHAAAIEQARKFSVLIFGLCSFLSNEGRRKIDNGDVEAGKRWLARAEQMSAVKIPLPSLSQLEIIRAAEDWSRRAAILRAGA